MSLGKVEWICSLKKIFLHILLGINFLFILVLALSYLSVYIPPDTYWVIAAFGLVFPLAIIMNISFVVLWAILKPNYLLYSLITILIGSSYINQYFQFKGKTSEEPALKVMSYNVRNFQGKTRHPSKQVADSIQLFMEQEHAEIICLQEIKLRTHKVFSLPQSVKDLPFINHYQYASTGETSGLATLTSFPIINMGEIRFEGSQNMAIFTDVLIEHDTVRVFNIHLQSYFIDPSKYAIIDSPGLSEEKDFSEAKEMGRKYRNAVIKRAGQARKIREEIDNSPYKVIVCGDLNDTPVSYAYKKVRGELKDAFVESGKGIGRTYIGKLPSYRIDFIFHSHGFEAFNFEKGNSYHSDHLPIYCNLQLNK